MTLKSEVEAARARHGMRVAALYEANWRSDRAHLVQASRCLMEKEIAAIKQRVANDNENRLSHCTGRVSDFDPTAGIPSKE